VSAEDEPRATIAQRKLKLPPPLTLRQAVMKVLGRGRELGAGDIFDGVQKIKHDAQYASLIAEVGRMRKENLVAGTGVNSRGLLYRMRTAKEVGSKAES
jgi:hypothetical protein